MKGEDNGNVALQALADITLGRGILMGTKSNPPVEIATTGGDITVESKARFRSSSFSLAAAGNITLRDSVAIKAIPDGLIDITATGNLELTRPKMTAKADQDSGRISLEGANVTIHDKAKFVAKSKETSTTLLQVLANSGDVSIDRIIATTEMHTTISGTNVAIGLPDGNGVIRTSRISQKQPAASVNISATDLISIEQLKLTTATDVAVTTAGIAAEFLGGTVKGIKGTHIFSVAAGAGSTCDLTGTTVKSATVQTACDTVIGP